MTEPRPPRPMPGPRNAPPAGLPRPPRPTPDVRMRARPDPNPLRMLLGLAGLASASAITTALLPSIMPATVAASQVQPVTDAAPQPSVIHVQRVVPLAPGQTAPPNSSVQIQPQPTPQVRVQIITRQSGGGVP